MKTMFNFILVVFNTMLFSQDIFEGYTLFTPQSGPGGGNNIRTRLLDNNLNANSGGNVITINLED